MKTGLSAAFLLTGTLILSGCQPSPRGLTEAERLNQVENKLALALQKLNQIRADLSVLKDPLSNNIVDIESFIKEAEDRKDKAVSLQEEVQDMINQDTVAGQFRPKNFRELIPCLSIDTQGGGFNQQRFKELTTTKELDEALAANVRLSEAKMSLSKNLNKPGFVSDLIMLEVDTNSHESRVDVAARMAQMNMTARDIFFSAAKRQEEALHQAYGRCLYSFDKYKTDRKYNALHIT